MKVQPKEILFSGLAAVAKALGHPHRLAVLEQVAQGERSVETVAARTGLAIANASAHLQQLRRAGLIAARRDGRFVFYRLADSDVLAALQSLHRVAERDSADIKQLMQNYFQARDALEPVSREDLMARLRDGLVTVLDVRPADEFALGHVPGAINIPLADLDRRLAELPPDQEVVAYCRGPYCVLSFEAVAALRTRGFTARRLEDGLPEWRAGGFPVEA